MKKEKKVGWLIAFLLAVPLAESYTFLCKTFQWEGPLAEYNLYINWFFIVVQNTLLYYLWRWERQQTAVLKNISSGNVGVAAKINFLLAKLHLKNIVFANILVVIVACFYFRAAISIVALKEKPVKYIPGVILGLYAKAYVAYYTGWLLAIIFESLL